MKLKRSFPIKSIFTGLYDVKGARLHFPLINKVTRYFTFIIVGLSKNVSALALLEEILDKIRVFSFDLIIDVRRRSPYDYDYE